MHLEKTIAQCKAKFEVQAYTDNLLVSIENQSAVGNQYYKWDFGNGDTLVDQEKRRFDYQYSRPGNYIIQLVVINTLTNCKDTAQHEVVTGDFETPSFNFKISENNNLHVEFSVPNKDLFTSFYWSFGDGNTSNSNEPGHGYSLPGKYLVSLTTTLAESREVRSFCREVLIDSSSLPYCTDFDYSLITATNELLFNNTSFGKGIAAYAWDFGDKNKSSDLNPTHTYAKAGFYNVCLSSIGNTGAILETYCKDIGFNTLNIGRPKILMQVNHEKLSIVSSLKPIEEIDSFSWETGDGYLFENEPVIHHTYSCESNYKLIVKGKTREGFPFLDLKILNFVNGNKPVVGFAYVLRDELLKTTKKKVALQGAVSGDISRKKIYWDFGDGTIDSLSLQPVHEFYAPGEYNVCFTIVDPVTRDTITSCETIAFSSPTGWNRETIHGEFDIFPNPVSSKMNITYESFNEECITISLHDLSGKKVSSLLTNKINPGLHSFTWGRDPDLPDGMYLLLLSTNTQNITRKVILF